MADIKKTANKVRAKLKGNKRFFLAILEGHLLPFVILQ